jgi:hypothetical protein
MEFYIFDTIDNNNAGVLENSGFDGVLLTYRILQGDFLTKVAADCHKHNNIKYLVAIRPYAISPQYLYMINKSLNSMCNNRFQINLISGWAHEDEKDFGGIIGDVNDLSSSIEKSNCLINYVNILNDLKYKDLDFYVSITNNFVFNATKNNKLIISYAHYLTNFKLFKNLENVMISVAPILRKNNKELEKINKDLKMTDTEYFTYDEFDTFLNNLKNNGIKQILLHDSYSFIEKEEIVKFVKQYKELQTTT